MSQVTNLPLEQVTRTGHSPEFLDRTIAQKAQVFKNRLVNAFFVRANGAYIHFLSGRYVTAVSGEIAELQHEIAAGNPHLYQDDEAEVEVSAAADQLAGLKAQIRAQVLKEIAAQSAAATDKSNDMGTSEQGKLNVQSSAGVSDAMSGSNSGAATTVANPDGSTPGVNPTSSLGLEALKAKITAQNSGK